MSKSKRFPYIVANQLLQSEDVLPFFPLTLSRENKTIEVVGLADSGATVNVLPYQIGIKLGAIWDNQMPLSRLAGNLGNYKSKGLIVNAKVADFKTVKLAFAWTEAEDIPLILGQTNFFSQFDVCFFSAR